MPTNLYLFATTLIILMNIFLIILKLKYFCKKIKNENIKMKIFKKSRDIIEMFPNF